MRMLFVASVMICGAVCPRLSPHTVASTALRRAAIVSLQFEQNVRRPLSGALNFRFHCLCWFGFSIRLLGWGDMVWKRMRFQLEPVAPLIRVYWFEAGLLHIDRKVETFSSIDIDASQSQDGTPMLCDRGTVWDHRRTAIATNSAG